ncbi:MAG: hypothetical protein ACI3XA_04640 [Clostridia bacterium]
MYKSGYTYKFMFNTVKNEIESYKDVPGDIMLLACNSVIQQLYGGVIKEQGLITVLGVVADAGSATQLNIESVNFEDIERISANGEDFTLTTPRRAGTYSNTYYKNETGGVSIVSKDGFAGTVDIYYNQRPKLVQSVESEEFIPLPNEYVPMLIAYVRAECYKWINEDNLAAKWMGDYNAQLEGFSAWVAGTKPQYG